MRSPRRLIVFGSSSLALIDGKTLDRVDVRGPVARHDLEKLADELPGTALILDGVFGSRLAVTPAECRQALEAGWTLAGASSMGALRASELWSAGMIGFGDIFNFLRTGLLRGDAEVAVVLDTETFRERTLSTVHIRCLLAETERKGYVDSALARRMLLAARSVYWAERDWQRSRQAMQSAGASEAALQFLEQAMRDPRLHPKARDGRLGVETLLARRWPQLRDADLI